MSKQNRPYCEALNKIYNTVNINTGTFTSKVQLATISSGLELPAVFSLDIYVGALNSIPDRNPSFKKGYLFSTPRLFYLYSDVPNLKLFNDGRVEYLHKISETNFENITISQYKIFHNPIKNIQIFHYKKNGTEVWFEIIYADGTTDIFDWRGILWKRVSPLGHSLIFTFIQIDDDFFLEKVEDEYGHAKIEISYKSYNSIKSRVYIEEFQENKAIKTTSISVIKDSEMKFEYVSHIIKYKDKSGEVENNYSYSYTILENQNYYITKYSENFKKIIEFSYKTIPGRENTELHVISKVKTYENALTDTYLLTKYKYSKNTYTGVTKDDSLYPYKRKHYDLCMLLESNDYTYNVIEYNSVIDKNYPNDNKEMFFIVRFFNKYHLLFKEDVGFTEEKVMDTYRKVRTVDYSYDNILKENNETIDSQPGNYSFWTTKTTKFFKEGEKYVEIEKQEMLEIGFPSKIIDKRGLEKNIKYHSPTNSRGAINLYSSITTISEDSYNKIDIDYTEVNGKEVDIPGRELKIQPVAYLPFKVTAYKDKDDKGLITEENKYDFSPLSGYKEFFFFSYKKETKKNGDLTLGNCLIENTIYSYSDSIKNFILLQSFRSNIAKNGDIEENAIIKCAIINPLTKLPINEWYQLSLDDNTQYNLINNTYDNFGRVLTKTSNQGKESYNYSICTNPYDENDLTWYKRCDYTDIYGLMKITLSNFYNQVVKIYGILPGQLDFCILEENKYMVYQYLKENIIYEYLSSNNEVITYKTVYDYKEFRLSKSTFSDGTFETYKYDEGLKITKTQKNHYLKQLTLYDFSDNVLKESIIDLDDVEYPLLTKEYDKYNRLSYSKTASGNTEQYFYDSFNRLVKKNVNIDASSNYGYTEEIIYPETALNSDKIITKIAKSTNGDENFYYSVVYNNYGKIIYENDTSYYYDLLKEEQLNKVQNGMGEVNYTYYLENDLPKTINYIQKKEEEPFKTIFDPIDYDSKHNLLSYTVKNLENNIEKNCGQINYTYTPLGMAKSFELKVGENVKDLESAVLITNNYSAYENLILSKNYKYSSLNFELKNTYDKISGKLETVEYTFGESDTIKFELIYNNDGPQTFSFGQLDSIIMTSPHFLINNTLKFVYDKQGRECGRNYCDTSDFNNILLSTFTEYQIDTSQIRSTTISSSQEESRKQTNHYDEKSGKLKESELSYPNLDYDGSGEHDEYEVISPLSINRIDSITIVEGALKKNDSYFYADSNKKDCIESVIQKESNKQLNKIDFIQDSCGNYTNDFDNSKIIYNVANKIINVEKKETLEKYNYYYYMTGELMCVSEIKENPKKIYYLYDNGKNVGELIYEGTILKIVTLYLDVHGVRLGRYIKNYEQNKELIELFFSELGGTVHKVILYEKNQGVTKKESYKYDLYGEKKTL